MPLAIRAQNTPIHTHAHAMAPPNVKIPRSPRDLDEDDFDFEYFSRTYKPLSNLPTPPPSSRNSIASTPVLGDEELDDSVKTLLLGMLFHLSILLFLFSFSVLCYMYCTVQQCYNYMFLWHQKYTGSTQR